MSERENSPFRRSKRPNPRKKEQDPAIISIFAEADEPVLTTKEVAEGLDIGEQQTRRRLYDLVDEGLVKTRKPSRDRIWWLDEEVKEPITVRYPLLRYVRDRGEIQTGVLGVVLGLAGAFLVMLFLGLDANEIIPPLISRGQVLILGLYSIAIGTALMISATLLLTVTAAFRRLHKRMSKSNDS